MIKRNRYKLLIEQTGQAWRLVERQCTHEGFKPGVPDVIEAGPYRDMRYLFDQRKVKPKESTL